MEAPKDTGILRWKTRERHGIVTRQEAFARGLNRFFTGYPCPAGHIDERETKTGKCVACMAMVRKPNPNRTGRFPKYSIEGYKIHQMLERQNGLCAICDDPISLRAEDNERRRTAKVDHCHDTGKVRGLLCGKCNSGLGMFRDNTEHLDRAITYLIKSREEEDGENLDQPLATKVARR